MPRDRSFPIKPRSTRTAAEPTDGGRTVGPRPGRAHERDLNDLLLGFLDRYLKDDASASAARGRLDVTPAGS